jgi:hypothetical protein
MHVSLGSPATRAMIAGAAFALLTVADPRAARANVEPIACVGSLQLNTSTTGKNDHGDQISSRVTVYAQTSGMTHFIGYEYQTYNGKEYIQFPKLFPSSLFPFHGSVYGALQDALTRTGKRQDGLPPPYDQLKADAPISRGACR